jgi:NTE family protein
VRIVEPQKEAGAARPMGVALALGGGGARGYAHIGVIRELQERGCQIIAVAGTSMGAVIGGLHAAGRLDAYVDWVGGLSQRDVLRLMDPSIKAPGVIRAEKVMGRVATLLEGARIEDLPIPYTAVATDLVAQREVWFQEGLLATALRASVAIPSLIAPVVVDGRLLADGGLMNNLPIAPLTPVRSDAVIAVSLSGPRQGPGPTPHGLTGPQERFEKVRRVVGQLRDQDMVRALATRLGVGLGTGGRRGVDAPEQSPEHAEHEDAVETGFGEELGPDEAWIPTGLRTREVIELSIQTMQRLITRYRLSAYPPDVLIEIPVDACGTFEFHRAGELIELGQQLARRALDAQPSLLSHDEPHRPAVPADGDGIAARSFRPVDR